jgi:hypothetical protein
MALAGIARQAIFGAVCGTVFGTWAASVELKNLAEDRIAFKKREMEQQDEL